MNDVDIDGGRLTGRNADVGLHSGQSLRLPMSTESQLREKLRKIEALFAGAGTAGERLAAEAALERVRARLGELSRQDPSIEMQFSMPDQWSRHLFLALCRRYGLKPYRYYRQRRNTVMIRAPKRFLDQVLWPEFSELDQALQAYLHPSSGDDARDPRGGLRRCKRGAGDFRGAATELMADLIMQQGGLCCVEPMPRAIIRRSSPSANH